MKRALNYRAGDRPGTLPYQLIEEQLHEECFLGDKFWLSLSYLKAKWKSYKKEYIAEITAKMESSDDPAQELRKELQRALNYRAGDSLAALPYQLINELLHEECFLDDKFWLSLSYCDDSIINEFAGNHRERGESPKI